MQQLNTVPCPLTVVFDFLMHERTVSVGFFQPYAKNVNESPNPELILLVDLYLVDFADKFLEQEVWNSEMPCEDRSKVYNVLHIDLAHGLLYLLLNSLQ